MSAANIFTITMGKFVSGQFHNGRQVGTAFYENLSNKDYYRLELWQYKSQSFYLTRNFEGNQYTLFSEIQNPGCKQDPIFQKPIGYGFITHDLPECLQIQFNLPWEKCFLNLKPIN